jgi:hypothetical protein
VSARTALEVAYRSGLSISVQNGRLCLRADEAPPPSVLELIKAHRTEILSILTAETDAKPAWRTQTGSWRTQNADANDAHVAAWVDWNERAAVLEFDGGAGRREAERRSAELLSPNRGVP